MRTALQALPYYISVFIIAFICIQMKLHTVDKPLEVCTVG